MVNRKIAIKQIYSLLEDLLDEGFEPIKAYLFGSVATGRQHADSDIDLAIWDDQFTGCLTIDYEPIKHILTKYPLIELHTFSAADDKYNNPWVAEILASGVEIDFQPIYEKQVITA